MAENPAPKIPSERLRMTHLEGGLEDMKASIEAAAKPAASPDDAMDEESYTFEFAYADSRGVKWEGSFTNHILSIEEQGFVSVLRAKLQGGQPIDAIDTGVLELNLALSHMTFSLDEKNRPEWAKANKLMKLKDASIVLELFAKVRAHEARYFRRPTDPGEG